MQISGLGNSAMQTYQSFRAAQKSQAPVQQVNNNVNQSTQLSNSVDADHDGDIDGKGKDIDVRV